MKKTKKYLLLFILIFGLALLGLNTIKTKADSYSYFYYITTTPGEDASKEIHINWHAKFKGSYLEYTLANDTEFKNAIKVMPTEVAWSGKDIPSIDENEAFLTVRYVCTVELKELTSRTKYIYRLVFDNNYSDVRSFTTAGLTNEWTFMALADLQNALNTRAHKMISTLYQASDSPALAVCSGDLTDTGADSSHWDWILNNSVWNNFIFATGVGDHEYHSNGDISPRPMMAEPTTFNMIFDNPKNGPATVQNSCYYFYYNNVLFVFLDMGDSNTVSGSRFTAQETWFKETMKKLEGTYQYSVVLDHKSLYGSQTTDSSVRKKLTDRWYPLFDEANVDLVLSGHDHQYSRTYPLYGNKVSTEEGKGTYYLDLCCSGNKFRVPSEDLTTDGLHECVLDLKTLNLGVGARIDVTEETMKVTVIDENGETRDQFTIQSKRQAKEIEEFTFDETKFENSFDIELINNTAKTGKIIFNDYEELKYVKHMTIKNENSETVLDNDISYNSSFNFSLANLKTLSYSVEVELLNGEKKTVNKQIELGTLDKLKVEIDEDEEALILSFVNNVTAFEENKYKLYVDDTYVKDLSSEEIKTKKVELDYNLIIGNHHFKIELYNGTLQNTFECSYQGFYEPEVYTSSTLNLKVGESSILDYYFEDGSLIEVTSSDEKIVKFENGTIKAYQAGEANIILEVKNTSYSYEIKCVVSEASAAKTGCNSGFFTSSDSITASIVSTILLTLSLSSGLFMVAFRRKDQE